MRPAATEWRRHRWTRGVLLALGLGAAWSVASPGVAYGQQTPADTALRDSLRTAIHRLASVEQGLARAAGVQDTAMVRQAGETLDALRDRVDSLLERVVLGTEWGGRELGWLRDRYPGSVVLQQYAARRALQDGRPADALAVTDRLLARRPMDPELHRVRARALESLGRDDDARMAYLRALDLDPGSEVVFRELLRMTDSTGLPTLLGHIQRMRRMEPDRAALLDREIELLQRLGRLDEARALQDTTGGAL